MTAPWTRPMRRPPHRMPPAVDEGGPSVSVRAFLSYLKPFPGRLTNTVRIVATSLLVLVIAETFRLPETAIIAYIPLVFFKDDADATTLMAPIACLAVLLSIGVSLLITLFALSEPALRVPLTGLIVLVTMFLSRASKPGQMFFIVGLMVLYTQKLGDDLTSGALSGSVYSNNTSYVIPDIAFMPPEEALLHNLLYLALAFAVPTIAIFFVNRLTMRDPIVKLREALAERFAAAAAFCEGEGGAREHLVDLANQGTGRLRSLNDLAGKVSRRRYDGQVGAGVIEGLSRLTLALLAWLRVEDDHATSREDLSALARPCRRIERAIRNDGRLDAEGVEDGELVPSGQPLSKGAAAPLVVELRRALERIESTLRREHLSESVEPDAEKEGGFFKPDAFSDPSYMRFALKITLATMGVYVFIQLTDWTKISTAIATCFLVGLDSVGQSVQKARLRLYGAIVGGAIGMTVLVFVMPRLTDIGDLLCLLTPLLLVSSWIRVGSERIAYFGQQVAFAFLLTTLQDFGPTSDLQTARDRMIGILIGETVVLAVFAGIWPVTVADVVRRNVGYALDHLATLLEERGDASREEAEARRSATAKQFGAAIGGARGAFPDARLEPAESHDVFAPVHRAARSIDNEILTQIQSLVIPTLVIARETTHPSLSLDGGERPALLLHGDAVSDWFRRCAVWTRTGKGGEDLRRTLPSPPAPRIGSPASAQSRATAEWHAILRREIVRILDEVGPEPDVDDGPVPMTEAKRDVGAGNLS